ncbi:hypothetical protein NMY22_g14255 [Coprinellus aureogranulatus]|nr:hypothetical protein NMY22_g14255 [Coprinellus aureogranulatus]
MVEYDPIVDDLQQFYPMFNALNSVTRTVMQSSTSGFVHAVVKAFSDVDVWPHRSPVHAAFKAGTTLRFIGFSYQSALTYCSGWYPEQRASMDRTSGVYCFHSVARAAVWLMAGGNENLREWGLADWVGDPASVVE